MLRVYRDTAELCVLGHPVRGEPDVPVLRLPWYELEVGEASDSRHGGGIPAIAVVDSCTDNYNYARNNGGSGPGCGSESEPGSEWHRLQAGTPVRPLCWPMVSVPMLPGQQDIFFYRRFWCCIMSKLLPPVSFSG